MVDGEMSEAWHDRVYDPMDCQVESEKVTDWLSEKERYVARWLNLALV